MLNINLKIVSKKLFRNQEVLFSQSVRSYDFFLTTKNFYKVEENGKRYLGHTFCVPEDCAPMKVAGIQ